MSTELPMDGNPVVAGATEPPAPPSSAPTGQLSQEQIKALLDLPNQIKGLQKGTDKQIGQVRADVKRILDLKEQGLNENQIQRELAIDAILEQGSLPKPLVGNENKGQSLDTDARAKVIAEANADPNDAGVLRLLVDEPDPVRFALKLGTHMATKGQPASSAANAPALQGGAAAGAPDVGKLKSEYIKDMAQNRGNRAAIKALQAEYQKKGLDLGSVGFGI